MGNVFDQFDQPAAAKRPNVFDQFDNPQPKTPQPPPAAPRMFDDLIPAKSQQPAETLSAEEFGRR
jgi:hypothetical protein